MKISDIVSNVSSNVNVTYVAVGCAYSPDGGMQQFPPFLSQLHDNLTESNQISQITKPNLIINIILIDPQLENPPAITKHLTVDKISDDIYQSAYVKILCSDQIFERNNKFAIVGESYNMLNNLILATVTKKLASQSSTSLLFVHLFTGGNRSNEIVSNQLRKQWQIYATNQPNTLDLINTYNQSVLIDLHNKNDTCFPRIDSALFGPSLITIDTAIYIVNPLTLTDYEIMWILSKCDTNSKLYIQTLARINNELTFFKDYIIPRYRKCMLSIINNCDIKIFDNTCNPADKILFNKIITIGNIINVLTLHDRIDIIRTNMLYYLESILSFTIFTPEYIRNTIFDTIFDTFCTSCESSAKIYDLILLFDKAQVNLVNALTESKQLISEYIDMFDSDSVIVNFI